MRVQVIAEIGINHQASVAVACDLARVAAEAGCDAVKLQKRTVEIAVPPSEREKLRATPWGAMRYIDYKHRIEFTSADYDQFDEYASGVGIAWTASAWDPASVAFLDRFAVPFHKVPSACITDLNLLRAVVDTGKPVVLSTGGSTWAEIDAAVEIVQHARRLTLLHCCSYYPHEAAHSRLLVLDELRQRYGFPVGYSGHEEPTHPEPTIAAVARGAATVERHITLSRSMWGSDQKASLEPAELRALVAAIRRTSAALSHGGERPVLEVERAKVMTMRRENW